MKYELKAYVLQDIGQRKNQEDFFYPPFIQPCHFDKTDRAESFYDGVPHTNDRLFLLCDGMGGHERGEVASRLACETMAKSLNDADAQGRPFDKVSVKNAVMDALEMLDKNDNASETRKMGTTMTLLRFHNKGVTIAYIGDSRVYHFRPSNGRAKARCLYRTEDHSLANDMLRSGRLTFQQLANFRGRNILTRCMMAGMEETPEADIYTTRDVIPGDIFMMCSDGMLEELYDEDLCRMITYRDLTDEQKVQMLLSYCEANQDNHTAWIIRVENVLPEPEDIIETVAPDTTFGSRLQKWFKGLRL